MPHAYDPSRRGRPRGQRREWTPNRITAVGGSAICPRCGKLGWRSREAVRQVWLSTHRARARDGGALTEPEYRPCGKLWHMHTPRESS